MGQSFVFVSSRWFARGLLTTWLIVAVAMLITAQTTVPALATADPADPDPPQPVPTTRGEDRDQPAADRKTDGGPDRDGSPTRQPDEPEEQDAPDEDPPEEDDAEDLEREARAARREAVRAARQALTRARDAEASAGNGSRGADGQRRRAEADTIPAVIARLEAEQRLAGTEAAIHRAERNVTRAERAIVQRQAELDEAHEALDAARRDLEARIVRAYKAGSVAAGTSLTLTLVREASSPGDLATMLKHLETLALVGTDQVDVAIEGLAAAEQALDEARSQRVGAEEAVARAVDRRDAAAAAIDDAEADAEAAEREAAQARASADDAEERLLTATRRRLQAEADLAATLARAEQEAAAWAADEQEPAAENDERADSPDGKDGRDGPDRDQPERAASDRSGAPTPAEAPDDEQAADALPEPGDKLDWLAAREKALTRARSLAPERRRTAGHWACPVEGGRYINDWSFPRSSGRRHEGTDVFAPRGTEIHAPVGGTVLRTDRADRFDGRRDLGGITVTVEAGDERFYFAHLDRIAPDIEVGSEVAAGDVVGTVGATGNARGTAPHLHLGWYVEDVAVNPYASLRVACRGEAG